MLPTHTARYSGMPAKQLVIIFIFAVVTMFNWGTTNGHELWVEALPSGTLDTAHKIHVCWGHNGERVSGPSLQGQHDKISTQVLRPDGSRSDLETTADAECFTTTTTPTEPGYYVVGAELQTGIISRPVHSIPANTRIIMYGKALSHVTGSEAGLENTLGQDLEIVLLTSPDALKPGDVVKARLLFHGKPLGGKDVEATLSTVGAEPLAEDSEIQSHLWATSAAPHPKTGEVAFPLIAGGRHFFTVRYYDETPGTYAGDRNDESSFSHLRQGDTFERTMYVSTLTIEVSDD